jgi:uncharacterized protein YbjQ (UPF0145 family)
MSQDISLLASGDLVGLVITIGLPLLLLVVTMLIGSLGRSRHRARLAQRRAAIGDMLVTDIKTFPGGVDMTAPPTMVVAEAIYSADYFMSVVSGLKKIVGGSMGFYRDLAERTREEVTLRLLETARAGGYDAVCNIRIEWSDITGNTASSTGQKVASVSLLAVGTAYRRQRGA